MLATMYARIAKALEILRKMLTESEESERRLSGIEQKQEEIIGLLKNNNLLLEEIRGAVIPDPAIRLILTAGSVQEQ